MEKIEGIGRGIKMEGKGETVSLHLGFFVCVCGLAMLPSLASKDHCTVWRRRSGAEGGREGEGGKKGFKTGNRG